MQQPPSLSRPATLKAVLEKEGAEALTWGSQRNAAMRRRSCAVAQEDPPVSASASAAPNNRAWPLSLFKGGSAPDTTAEPVAGPQTAACSQHRHRNAPPPAPSAATGAAQRVVSELNASPSSCTKPTGLHSRLLGRLQSLVQPPSDKHAKHAGNGAVDHHVHAIAVLGRLSRESSTIVPTPLVRTNSFCLLCALQPPGVGTRGCV
jgi:hypothetical protein